MSLIPPIERIQVEIAVAMSIREQYGTNQPLKTYEDGIAEALLWVLGGQEPQNHAQSRDGWINIGAASAAPTQISQKN